MDRDDVLIGIGIAAAAVGAAEVALRLSDRAESKRKFNRERRTLERPWERFDSHTGWEPIPRFVSGDVIINRYGFRGQDLIKGDVFRIMCLGDSTTFGPPGDKNTYPYALQTALARRRTNFPVEVVNAGVSGHTTCNMRFRIRRLMTFRPSIVLVMAGWNDLYNDNPGDYRDSRHPYTSYWRCLAGKNIRCHLAAKLFAAGSSRASLPVSYSAEEFVPFNFDYNLRTIIGSIRKGGAVPILITLPKRVPDNVSRLTVGDRKAAALPIFLHEGDFKGFLKLYQAYDDIIRQVASDTVSPLFDAARHFKGLEAPRARLFDDVRHLTPDGCGALAAFIAKSLIEQELIP
jgi:hypothetical protein